MDPAESSAIIETAGGSRAFAKLIGVDDKPHHHQLVNNWKSRGIPAHVVLENLELIRRLQSQIAAPAKARRKSESRVA
jgi:hypothetical protein